MRSRSAAALSAAISFVVSFVAYLRTLAPTVAFVDSGELTLAAARLGIPHPPGFPLWVMLTHLFTWLPIETVAWRVNLASAFYASAAAALVAVCIAQILMLRRRNEEPMAILIAATFGGLLLPFARTTWACATIAEVYTLNLAMMLAVVACMLQSALVARDRWLYVAAALFGASLGVHLAMSALLLPAIAWLVIRTRGWEILRSRQFAVSFAVAVAAVALVYAYEPIASSRQPVIDWGGTSSLDGFIDHVTAKQYRRDVTQAKWQEQFAFTRALLGRELGPAVFPVALLGAVAGAWLLWRSAPRIFAFVALIIAANVGWVLTYPILDDQDAYLLPTIFALVLFAAVSVAAAFRRWRHWAAIALVVPILACVDAWPMRDRSRYDVARRYVDNALRSVERNGLILSNLWNFISPFAYLQEVEGVRPDVKVITVGMLQWPWYLDQLERQYPELMRRVKPQADAFRPWAERWVATPPREWDVRYEWREPYRETYNALVLAMAETQLAAGGAVYATRDFVVRDESDTLGPAAMALESRYDLLPLGLVNEYVPRGSVTRLEPLPLDLRGIADGAVKWEPGDVMERVVEMYERAYRMHGRFAFMVTRQPELANASYRAAQSLSPGDESIERERATFEARAAGASR